MRNKLYIGNLSRHVDESTLTGILSNHGTVVKARIVSNNNLRSARCYAIVEMLTEEEVATTIDQLNGRTVAGRDIQVRRLNFYANKRNEVEND